MDRANTHGRLRSMGAVLGTLAIGAATLLAGCGTRGYASPLAKTSTVTLPGAVAGSVTLESEYATHVEIFYPSSTAIPYSNAATPAELRQANCIGPYITTLGDTTPTTDEAGNAKLPHPLYVGHDAAGGWDVSVPQSDQIYVAVLANQHAAPEDLVACGHPLSARRQYFDLYPPSVGSNGSGVGIVKMEPIQATHIVVSLNAPAAAKTTWAVHQGSCQGQTVTSGVVNAGATAGDGYVFSQRGSSWYVSLQSGASGKSVCQKAS